MAFGGELIPIGHDHPSMAEPPDNLINLDDFRDTEQEIALQQRKWNW